MKLFRVKYLLALAVALSALNTPVLAASSEDLADIRNQLRNLLERVDRLERENEVLKAQNETLQAEGTYGRSEGPRERENSARQVDDTEALSLAERVQVKGDLRYRHEQTRDDTLNASGERSAADRYRDRIRMRLSAEIQATRDVAIGVGVATGEGSDPRSSNQTLGDVFARKTFELDLAYFDWSFADWGHVIGGKMKQPFYKPGQSMFWDDDVNPEGLALMFERGVLFGSAYGYWVEEVTGPPSTRTSDTMLIGGQIGARLPIGESNFVFAAHYYDLSAGQGRAPFYAGDPNGNTTIDAGVPPAAVLLYDYRVVDLMAELSTSWNAPWGEVPLRIWADVAQNQDPDDLDIAWAVGAALGDASDARTWEIAAAYQSLEKDALFAQIIDSDFGNGLSDATGWVLRAGYAPVKNVTFNATYFMNARNVDEAGQTDVDFDRLQIDLNMKF